MNKTDEIRPVALPIRMLRPFPNHPYQVRDDDAMFALMDSIDTYGVLAPVLVRRGETGYEIISGHRRCHAARAVGLNYVPAIVCDLSRDEAAILLVDSNLHREHLLPSEKAFAYKLKLEALKQQGKRTDLTSRQNVGKLESADQVSETESGRQVQRYIRLTCLQPELLKLVDQGKIALSVGVELSYLNELAQNSVVELIEQNEATPSYSQAVRMHRECPCLATEQASRRIQEIMREEKPNQQERISIPADRLRPFFPEHYTAKDIQQAILALLEKERRRKREQAAR